jgi:hypothetical protein
MGKLEEVNRLASSGMSEFRIESYDGLRLLLVGSFDLCYYHDIELAFTDVAHINLPTEFYEPEFADVGQCQCDCCKRRRFAVRAEGSVWEVIAQAVDVVIGKVYHYDRGDELKPGERIADWVPRKQVEQHTTADRPRD